MSRAVFKQVDVTRAIKGMTRAGVDITRGVRVEIDKAGKMVIIVAGNEPQGEGEGKAEVNEWDSA
jgi:hypothetical protein